MATSEAQILVVRNEPRTTAQIQRELERLGYTVTVVASSPNAAVAYLQLSGQPKSNSPPSSPPTHKQTSRLLDNLRSEIDKELTVTINEALHGEPADGKSRLWRPTKGAPNTTAARLVHDSQWLATILRAVADGVVATDRAGVVRFINPVAQQLTGWSEQEALGKPIREIVNSVPPVDEQAIGSADHGEGHSPPTVEARLTGADGREIAIEQNATPIHDQAGQPAGCVYVLRDISERLRVQTELEQINRLKSDFVATMSHELRAPLHVIMGYNDLLLTGEFGRLSSDQTMILQRVHDTARQLAEVIQTTLDWSRLDTGRVLVERQTTDVCDLIEALDVELQELQRKPGVEFVWAVATDLPTLETDPIKLKVVLRNLINNAMKFTAAGRVTVSAQAADGGVEFRVTDTGIGIAPDAKAMIFEPFRQVVEGGSSGGVGLGLYIVRRLLALLGGRVEVESDLGCGSTFRVWLPTSPPHATDQYAGEPVSQ